MERIPLIDIAVLENYLSSCVHLIRQQEIIKGAFLQIGYRVIGGMSELALPWMDTEPVNVS